MDRRSLVVGVVAGAALAALAIAWTPVPTASAEDPPILGPAPQNPMFPVAPGPTINPSDAPSVTRATGGGGGFGMGGANADAIALSAPVGGESVVYYFDTKQQRLLVYQYVLRGDKSGLRLVAARHFDYDLKLEDYGTTPSRADLKEAYDAAFARSRAGEIPAKRVDLDPGR